MGEQMRLAALIVLMLSGLAFGAVEVTIVSSRGALTNQVAFATNTFLSAEDSEFYKQTIAVTPYDLVAEAQAGTNYYMDIDWDFTTTEGKRATLVAPNIAVSCEHWHHNVGETMIFGAYTAKVIRVELDPAYYADGTPVLYSDGSQVYRDYCFMELDRDLPIEPCTLAPTNFQDYFDLGKWSWYSNHVPFFVLRQNGSIVYQNIFTLYPSGGGWGNPLGLSTGDSGSPVFLIIEGKPVLVGVATMVKSFVCIQRDLMPVERGWGL